MNIHFLAAYYILLWLKRFSLIFFRSHKTMVKAVVVLGSSEGVKGTIYFTQEGDGNLNRLCPIIASGLLSELFQLLPAS